MKEKINVLKKIEEKVEKGKIVNKNTFKNQDMDHLLDLRDEKIFDSEWMRVFESLRDFQISLSEKEIIDTIREKSFKKTYELSESGDMAACVSDDLELICKAYLSNLDDVWLNSLIMSYVNHIFPCGELEKTENPLEVSVEYLIQ